MEPESKRHTMSHPPERFVDVSGNNIKKNGNKNDKKKVLLNLQFANVIINK